jgi:dTMP kinase
MSVPDEASTADPGRFVVFEGADGTGKSTQARLLAELLDARLTREPGGTAVGARIREVVLDPAHPELADRTEALLMAADRAQHVAELIRPTLRSGRHVVSDRFVASSLAYQGAGRGLGVDAVRALNDFGTAGLQPDLVILLEVDPETADHRLGHDLDRIESSGRELAESVRATYRSFAADDPELWVVVDGRGTPAEVADRVAVEVKKRLGIS